MIFLLIMLNKFLILLFDHGQMKKILTIKSIILNKLFARLIEDQSANEIVACVIAGCCEVDDIPHSDVCLNKDGILSFFYVRSDRQNQGLAQQLMDIILPWFDEQYPSRPIWLTVWSKDVLTQLMKRPANL